MRWYLKELVNNTVRDRNGVAIPFIAIGGGYGYLGVEEGSTLAEDLDKLVGRSGVLRVSEAEVESKKKQFPYRPSAPQSNFLQVAPDRKRGLLPPREGVAAVNTATAPAVVPLPPAAPTEPVPPAQPKGFKMRTGKAKVAKTDV